MKNRLAANYPKLRHNRKDKPNNPIKAPENIHQTSH
jgi:hypothetical protein